MIYCLKLSLHDPTAGNYMNSSCHVIVQMHHWTHCTFTSAWVKIEAMSLSPFTRMNGWYNCSSHVRAIISSVVRVHGETFPSTLSSSQSFGFLRVNIKKIDITPSLRVCVGGKWNKSKSTFLLDLLHTPKNTLPIHILHFFSYMLVFTEIQSSPLFQFFPLSLLLGWEYILSVGPKPKPLSHSIQGSEEWVWQSRHQASKLWIVQSRIGIYWRLKTACKAYYSKDWHLEMMNA